MTGAHTSWVKNVMTFSAPSRNSPTILFTCTRPVAHKDDNLLLACLPHVTPPDQATLRSEPRR